MDKELPKFVFGLSEKRKYVGLLVFLTHSFSTITPLYKFLMELLLFFSDHAFSN